MGLCEKFLAQNRDRMAQNRFVERAAFDATLAPTRCLAMPEYKMVQVL